MFLAQKLKIKPNNYQRRVLDYYVTLGKNVFNYMASVINMNLRKGIAPSFSKFENLFKSIVFEKFPGLKKCSDEVYYDALRKVRKAYGSIKATRFTKEIKLIKLKENPFIGKTSLLPKDFEIIKVKGRKYPYIKLGKYKRLFHLKKQFRFKGIINRLYIEKKGGEYYFTFCFIISNEEYLRTHPSFKIKTGEAVGIDLGLTNNITLSTGDFIEFKEMLTRVDHRIMILHQRLSLKQGPKSKDDTTKRSKNFKKVQKQLIKSYNKRNRIINDSLQKITTLFVANFDQICIEDLAVSQLMKNRSLAKSLGVLSLYKFRSLLEQKCNEADEKMLVVANRYFPSSKTCSYCGNVKKKLGLDERIYHCNACGKTIDRDLNAALNLKQYLSSFLGRATTDVKARVDLNLKLALEKRGFKTKNDSQKQGGIEPI